MAKSRVICGGSPIRDPKKFRCFHILGEDVRTSFGGKDQKSTGIDGSDRRVYTYQFMKQSIVELHRISFSLNGTLVQSKTNGEYQLKILTWLDNFFVVLRHDLHDPATAKGKVGRNVWLITALASPMLQHFGGDDQSDKDS